MKILLAENVSSLEQLKKLVAKINELVDKNSIVLLEGDLGAGKTTFVAHFCELHNISHVQSPTYAVHNRYRGAAAAVDHFDLYRLENEEQIEASGFYDLMNSASPSYKFIEWSERLESDTVSSFKNCYRLKIELLNSTEQRAIILSKLG